MVICPAAPDLQELHHELGFRAIGLLPDGVVLGGLDEHARSTFHRAGYMAGGGSRLLCHGRRDSLRPIHLV